MFQTVCVWRATVECESKAKRALKTSFPYFLLFFSFYLIHLWEEEHIMCSVFSPCSSLLFFVPNSVNEEEASSQPSVAMVFEVVGGEEVKRRCTHRQSTILGFLHCVYYFVLSPLTFCTAFSQCVFGLYCVWYMLCLVFRRLYRVFPCCYFYWNAEKYTCLFL